MQQPFETLDIAHLIRNRLTSIALCTDALQVAVKSELPAMHRQEFQVIQASIKEIKTVLDRMAACFQAELLALKQRELGIELIGNSAAIAEPNGRTDGPTNLHERGSLA